MNGLVLSGGGARAAYQVGALKALYESLPEAEQDFQLIFGSSIGAVNGALVAAGLRKGSKEAVQALEEVWRERTFSNSFAGTLSMAFMRSIRMGFLQYLKPGAGPTSTAIFDPSPLSQRIDELLYDFGGASVDQHPAGLSAVGVMATEEGASRKSVLIVNSSTPVSDVNLEGSRFGIHTVNHLSASHLLASAALPFVLPPVKLDTEEKNILLVDGGIANNLPVDPAVRFGAKNVVLIDTSGKKWWHDFHNRPYYTAETWAIDPTPGANCLVPSEFMEIVSPSSFGKILKNSIGSTTREFIRALGPVWPVYQFLNKKMGEECALETISYAVLYKPYIAALIELGYDETKRSYADCGSSSVGR